MVRLQETHPILFNFFAGYFPEADLDGLSDEQVVLQYIKMNTIEVIEETKRELNLIANDEEVLQAIAADANRYFESTDEIQQWIEMIKAVLRQELKE